MSKQAFPYAGFEDTVTIRIKKTGRAYHAKVRDLTRDENAGFYILRGQATDGVSTDTRINMREVAELTYRAAPPAPKPAAPKPYTPAGPFAGYEYVVSRNPSCYVGKPGCTCVGRL